MRWFAALLASGAIMAVCASAAQAQPLDEPADFNIPAQPLDQALLAFSRQANVQVVSAAGAVANQTAPSVRMRAARRDALRALLRASGLTFTVTAHTTVIILPAGPGAPGVVEGARGAREDAAPGPWPAAPEVVVDPVVVTGSRIRRRDLSAPTPIMTISRADLRASGSSNAEAGLNQFPEFMAAGNATNGGRGNGQRATLNLRGLGTNRNLVLLDGRRLPLASALGEVDVNILPTGIIQNVEVLTGGASAVYGSDAISGVVNFISRKNLKGVEIEAQVGDTQKNDLRRRELTFSGGSPFADGRGKVLASLVLTDRERLPASRRPFFELATLSSFLGYGAYVPATDNLPSQAVVNNVFGQYGVTGDVPLSQPFGFNDDRTLFTVNGALNYRGRTSGDYVLVGGNVRHPFGATMDLASAQRRRVGFGRADFSVTPALSLYAQGLFVDTWTDQDDGTSLTQYGVLNTVPVTNPFIPADLRRVLASRPDPLQPFEFNGRYVGVPHKGWTDDYRTSQMIAGAQGAIGVSDWTFDAYLSHDRTEHRQTQRNGVIKARVQNLLNAADGGASICAGGYNPFGDAAAHALSQPCVDYVATTVRNRQSIRQTIGEASMQGRLAALPAGDLRFAVVADRRVQAYRYTPDPLLTSPGAIEATQGQTPAQGRLSVSELSGELRAPLVRDLPLAQSVTVNLAYRYSDYNLAGGSSTYKMDGDWTLTPGLLLRAGYAHAVRAPNMGESFFNGQVSAAPIGNPPAGGEPCDVRTLARQTGGAALRMLCIATGVPVAIVETHIQPTSSAGNSVTNGNPDLKPESADTLTAGFVARRRAGASSLSVSADLYDIRIKDVIATVPAATAISKCYNLDGSNPSYSAANLYCGRLHRNANGDLIVIDTPYLNLGGLHVRGVDAVAAARVRLGGGTATFDSVIGYRLKDETQAEAGAPWQDFVGTGVRFRWQAMTSFGYDYRTARLSLRWRYYDGAKDPTSVTRPASPAPGVRPYNAFDLVGSYQLGRTLFARLGINNLFDASPRMTGGTPGATNAGIYDVYGRSLFVSLRTTF